MMIFLFGVLNDEQRALVERIFHEHRVHFQRMVIRRSMNIRWSYGLLILGKTKVGFGFITRPRHSTTMAVSLTGAGTFPLFGGVKGMTAENG